MFQIAHQSGIWDISNIEVDNVVRTDIPILFNTILAPTLVNGSDKGLFKNVVRKSSLFNAKIRYMYEIME